MGHPQPLRRLDATLACDDGPVGVDQDEIEEPKCLERPRDRVDLLLAVPARIAGIGNEFVDRQLDHRAKRGAQAERRLDGAKLAPLSVFRG